MIVPECLMIEPTETESREVLDKFAKDFLTILSENPEVVQSAPHNTDVRRVDEMLALEVWYCERNSTIDV